MTEVQIRDALSNATSYPELFAIATKLKEQGAKEVTVNRCVKAMRNSLLKNYKHIPKITPIPFDNNLIKNDNPFISCDFVPANIYGNIIEVTGNSVIMR